MNNQKKSLFGTGVLIGAALGTAAAFFFSPKSGKENREMAKKKFQELQKMMKNKSLDEIARDIFGKATSEGKKLYTVASKEMNTRLADMKETVEDIDKAKYVKLVDDVMERVKKEADATGERLAKLKDYFMDRWSVAQDMAQGDIKKMAKMNGKGKK